MTEIQLKNGNRMIVELHDDANGHEFIVDYMVDADGNRLGKLKRCTCACAKTGTSASGTCEEPSKSTCDCTGKSAKLSGCN